VSKVNEQVYVGRKHLINHESLEICIPDLARAKTLLGVPIPM